MSKPPANPGALAGEQLISLAEPFGGWISPLSGTAGSAHFLASAEGNEASTFAKQNQNQYAESSGMTLFELEKMGHMAPGHGYSAITDASSFITEVPLNGGVESTNKTGVLVLKNGSLVRLAFGGLSTTATYIPTGHTGVSSVNGDMILFRDYSTAATEWAVWSYDYSGGSDIAIAHSSNFGSPNDTFFSNTLSGTLLAGVPHKLCAGPDGNIYVTDGPYVRQIVVGSTAALSSATLGNVLQLGSGWTAMGICSDKNYIAIIASNKYTSGNFAAGFTRVFLWDGTATTTAGVTSVAPQYIYDVPDNFGNGIYFDGITLFAFTNGRNNSSKIFELTGKGFQKVFETPFIASSTTPIQGGIENFQDGLLIAAMKGDTYGHVFRYYVSGFHDEGYLAIGDLNNANISNTVGMIKNLFGNIYFIGVKYNSTYTVLYRDVTQYQTSTSTSIGSVEVRSILYTSGILGRRQYPLGFKMTLSRMKLFLSQWGTGASLYLSAFRGYDAFSPGGTNDMLNILIDTDVVTPNGEIVGVNPGGFNTQYYHYGYPAGTDEIDLSTVGVTDLSSFYINVRWTHTTTNAVVAVIRRIEMHIAQSQ